MNSRFNIRLQLEQKSNTDLLNFANGVALAMNGNASYPTPNPTLLDLGAAITGFSDALTAYGTSPSLRGSTLQHQALVDARNELEDDLTAMAHYCMTTTPNSPADFLSGGWEVKSEKSPSQILEAVRNLRQFISRDVDFGQVKISWKKGLDTPAGITNAYNVYRNTTASFGGAALVATVTKTTFTDSGLTNPHYFYWVVPIGAAGEGITSDICLATVAIQP